MKIWNIWKYQIILFLILLLPQFSFATSIGNLRLSLVEGDVQVWTDDAGEWVAASINMPLRENNRIWVPDGARAEIQVRGGTYIRLNEKTSLEILTNENRSLQFYINTGRAYIYFTARKYEYMQIDTPVSSVTASEKAIFMVDLKRDGIAELSVKNGTVDIESRLGEVHLRTGNRIAVYDDGSTELLPSTTADEWERWNGERDRRIEENRYSMRYLPEELSEYSHDFDVNGKWVYVREYGYVWTPTVFISVGWSPYRQGRWVWISGDYVWIGYEPWGWVPYHYGRWAFVRSVGWCWVPPVRGAVYWGPGYVGWVSTPGYIAWVPLAPGEIYYGYGYFGPYSVNVKNRNIIKIMVKKAYKNVYVENAVSIVHHDTFIKGKHIDVKLRENPFLKEKISIGRPDIKPQKTTIMPVIKDIPKAKEPPARIKEIKIRELKATRPLIRAYEKPVRDKERREKELIIEQPEVNEKVRHLRKEDREKSGWQHEHKGKRREIQQVPSKTFDNNLEYFDPDESGKKKHGIQLKENHAKQDRQVVPEQKAITNRKDTKIGKERDIQQQNTQKMQPKQDIQSSKRTDNKGHVEQKGEIEKESVEIKILPRKNER